MDQTNSDLFQTLRFDRRERYAKRCADIDLNKCFTGGYAVPAVENDDGPEDEIPPEELEH